MRVSGKRVSLLVVRVAIVAAAISVVLPLQPVYATGQLTSRSLTLQPGATDGASKPLGVVKHLFSFTIPASETLGSIQFLYCTTAAGTCTMPTGLVTTSATYGTESGATGFSLTNTTNGAPYIHRAATVYGGGAVSYQLLSVTNPGPTANLSFYVRISTYASTDTTGAANDTGVVAASTATQITLTGTMPESLIFCTGGTVTTNGGGIPDCSTASSGAVSFDRLFSPADTSIASSQMAASTNASNGYNITVAGTTLTSGSNTITAMTTSGGSLGTRGLSQFGLNLKANTTTTSTPAVGVEVAPASNGTNFKGQANAGYNTVDKFRFMSGESVADSANGGTNGPTDAQIYSVSYIVNVSGGQPVGTYTTTLTYVCTATF